MKTAKLYRLAEREAPILLDVDLVVAGGGFAGVCAAVAAARLGAKVAIVERDGLLGGQAAEVYTFGLDGIYGDAGRRTVAGLPSEIILRAAELGDSDPSWTQVNVDMLESDGYDAALAPLGMSGAWRSYAWLDRGAFRHVLRSLCAEERVTVILESPIIDAMTEGDRVMGVVAQGTYGPFAVSGSAVVDTTPSAVVAAATGHKFAYPDIYLGTHPHVGGVDIGRLIEYACDHPDDVAVLGTDAPDVPDAVTLMAKIAKGVPISFRGFTDVKSRAVRHDSIYTAVGVSKERGDITFCYDREGRGTYWLRADEWRFSRLDDPLHLSQAILALRQSQWLTNEMFRHFVPGFDHAHLEDVHPHIARALRISKEPGGYTDYDVTWDDIRRGGPDRSDRLIRVMGHPQSGQPEDGWMLPFAAMLPKEIEGLLVTGKPACRFIHYHATVAAVGHAAGVAGGLAARNNIAPRQLDVGAVRNELRRQGAIVD